MLRDQGLFCTGQKYFFVAPRGAPALWYVAPMPVKLPFHHGRSKRGPTAPGIHSFLNRGALAALMPTVNRLMALQKDCASALPVMFQHCDILQFEAGQLVLATPNAAVAAKLKQQLPKLQSELERRGWHVTAIKLKVQVTKSLPPVVHTTGLELPTRAVDAMEDLSAALPASKQNLALIAALRRLVKRRREPAD